MDTCREEPRVKRPKEKGAVHFADSIATFIDLPNPEVADEGEKLPSPSFRSPLMLPLEKGAHQAVLRRILGPYKRAKASADASPAAHEDSAAERPTFLCALGPDLLHRIFTKLAPHPKDLAPLAAVCIEWRTVMQEMTYKELCWQHGGGLVQELGYTKEAGVPPGGWAGLYKLLVYCPGLHYWPFHPVLYSDTLQEDYSWRDGLGHVQAHPQGFCTGQAASNAVQLAPRFHGDKILMSLACSHTPATAYCDADAPRLFACRGLVRDFETSELARVVGVAAYQREGYTGREGRPRQEKVPCPYCNSALFPLLRNDFSDETFHDYEDLFSVSSPEFTNPYFWHEDLDDSQGLDARLAAGCVCERGHLIFGLAGPKVDEGEDCVSNSGEGLQLQRAESVVYLTGHMAPCSHFPDGQRFVDQLDLSLLTGADHRLAELHRSWPSQPGADGALSYKVFSVQLDAELMRGPISIRQLLKRNLPQPLFVGVHGYILEGKPSLGNLLASFAHEFKVRKDAEELEKGRAERRQHIYYTLWKAGFAPIDLPNQQAVDLYVQDPGAISVEEVVRQQQQARDLQGSEGQRPALPATQEVTARQTPRMLPEASTSGRRRKRKKSV